MNFLIWKLFFIFIIIDIILKMFYNKYKNNSKKNIPEQNFQISNPRVSIIIPVYNNEKYLSACLDSLINQTLYEIEIICIDDGSTDNSLYILNKYAEIDKRIIILKQKNKGAGFARNYAMNVAKGEYLSFLDSNDFFEKNLFYDVVNVADKLLTDIIIYKFKKYNNTSHEYISVNYVCKNYSCPNETFNYKENPNEIFISFTTFTWNKLFRHSFIKQINLNFQEIYQSNDLFFTSISLIYAKKIFLLDKFLLFHRIDILNNLQNTKNLYSFNFYKALLKIKLFLEEKNLFNLLKESFKNLVIYTTTNNLNHDVQQNIYIYEQLKKEKFENLGIGIIPPHLLGTKFNEEYLDNLYFKHINLVNKNIKEIIIKKSNYLFKPKISVIIPIYNVENYIIQCLMSISKQKLKEIEIICVNDGSIDNSLSILQKYAENDNRIMIISQINRGLSEARNVGFKYSNGEYIYFIDGDDYLDENGLFELYNKAKENNLDIVYFDADCFFDKTYGANKELKENLELYKNYYIRKHNYNKILKGTEMFLKMVKNKEYRSSACLQLIKKNYYLERGLSFYPGILYEDNLFSLITILFANKTSHINKPFYKRRLHTNSIINTKFTVRNLYGYLIIFCEIEKLLEKNNFNHKLKKAIKKEQRYIGKLVSKINMIIPYEQTKILLKKLTVYQSVQYNKLIQKKKKKKKKKK